MSKEVMRLKLGYAFSEFKVNFKAAQIELRVSNIKATLQFIAPTPMDNVVELLTHNPAEIIVKEIFDAQLEDSRVEVTFVGSD